MSASVICIEPGTKRTQHRGTPVHTITSARTRSDGARHDMKSLRLEPFWLCEWRDVVFLHLETDPQLLQGIVPFKLDLFDGRALVSLVAFTLKNMRPRMGGNLASVLFKPFGTHRFLNVRAYVRHGNARGIYFLAEYLDAPWLNHLAGPLLYGLPFHVGKLDYKQDVEATSVTGTIVGNSGTIHYQGKKTQKPANDADEFLLERYRAFTHRKGRDGWFPVWHKPWRYQSVDAQLHGKSLLRSTGDWSNRMQLVSAHYSEGFEEVWMGLRQAH